MKMLKSFLCQSASAFIFLWSALPGFAEAIATKNGITWTFDHNYTTGKYANGDPWVVGPVTITSISPVPTEGRNGTMLNPQIGSAQGFDKDLPSNPYSAALNVGKNLPLTVGPDNSVVSSVTADGTTSWDTIQMFAILTVVKTAPELGSFRPPAIGAGSRASLWKESQLDYSKLNSLPRAPLTAAPSIAAYVGWFSYPWLELDPLWTGGYLRPFYMAPNGYGRELAHRTGDAALLLNLDYSKSEKRDLLVGVVQVGIDNYGFISKGGVWTNDGGHNIGRLSPLIIAAGVLNDNRLKAVIEGSAMKFQEFQTTFFVGPTDVSGPRGVWSTNLGKFTGINDGPLYPYTNADIGKPEWGIRHSDYPNMDNNSWGVPYRDINGLNLTAPTMAAQVMDLRDTIKWEPLFLYARRHLDYEQSSGYKGEFVSNPTPLFFKQFYNTYKNATLGSGGEVIITPPLTPTFAKKDRIRLSKTTNVRSSGAITNENLLGTKNAGSDGTIEDGPIGPDSDNITWWYIAYDLGVSGWCGQDNLVKLPSDRPVKPHKPAATPPGD